MKILHISKSVIPSSTANSIQVMKMCNALSCIGYSVHLLAVKGTPKMDIKEYYKTYEPFQIYFSHFYNHLVNIPFYLWNIWRVKPDIVYGRSLYGCFLAILLGFPVYYELHDANWEGGRFAPLIYRFFLKSKKLKKIIFITQSLKNKFLEDWPTINSPFQILPDGADLPSHSDKTFILKTRSDDYNQNLKVGYCGSLFKGKGMEIVQNIAPVAEGVEFHILGGTPEKIEEWKNKIKEKNVYFYGNVPHGSVSPFLNLMDVCILPNQQYVKGAQKNGEGNSNIADYTSPLKLFEYMAHKKAIIASDMPVIREILTDNYNALLVEPDDTIAWIDALHRMRDKKLREQIQYNAHKDFLEKYTWRKRAEHLFKDTDCNIC